MSSYVLLVVDPEGVLICFKEPFCSIVLVLDPVALRTIQMSFFDHQERLAATVSGRSEERIVDGSLGRAEDLEVDFTQFGGIVVSEYPVPMCLTCWKAERRCNSLR